jgi:hypothetical protein
MAKKEIYPLRDGYKGTAPPEVLAAVREKQTTWDGLNWIALRMHIVMALPDGAREDLNMWTFSHIIQFFHNLKNPAALKLGAESNTSNWTITPATFSTIRIPIEPIGKPAATNDGEADKVESEVPPKPPAPSREYSKPFRVGSWYTQFKKAKYSQNESDRFFSDWLAKQVANENARRDSKKGPVSFCLSFLKTHGVTLPE